MDAFDKIKKMITSAPVLRYYDTNLDVTIECDASDYGLGAVLLQQNQPICYASRTLTPTERNYAQIEKECLAIVFATERFEQYVLGCDIIHIKTDHKPLTNIFKKSLLASPKRLQRMLLRLQKFNLNVTYQKGEHMYISDTLSRACLPYEAELTDSSDYIIFKLQQEQLLYEEIAVINHSEHTFVTDSRLEEIKKESNRDNELQLLISLCPRAQYTCAPTMITEGVSP